MSIGIWQIVIIVLIVLVFFGRGKISSFMGDLGKGVTSFKKGLADGKEEEEQKQVSKKSAPGAKKKTAAKSKK